MLRKIFAGAVLAAVVCSAVAVQAATLTLSATYSTTTSADGGTDLGQLLTSAPHTVTPDLLNVFDLTYAITGAAANEDFNAMQFDVILGPGLAAAIPGDFAGWGADTPQFNPTGAAPNAGIYSTNADEGANTNDLQRIIVIGNSAASGATPIAYMHGFRPGITGTGRIGDIYLTFDRDAVGAAPGKATSVNVAPNGAIPWATYVDANAVDQNAASFLSGGPANIVCPQCGSIVAVPTVGDLALSTTSLNQVIGGQVAVQNVVDLSFNSVGAPTFTPLIPGKTLSLPNLPTLDDAGNFSWDTQGAKRGTYVWGITGVNGANSDGGAITVNVNFVPEPATFAMLGLALVGCVGFIRRRS